jgi:cytochrome c556
MLRPRPSLAYVLLIAGLTFATASSVMAAEQTGKQVAQQRHADFEKIGDAYETLEKQIKKSKPDTAVIQREAALVLTMGKEIPNWFPEGSGPDKGIKTKARAEIWTQAADFARLQETFMATAEKLNQTAAAGDFSTIAAQFEQMGEACSECHKQFRKDKSLFSIFGG